MRTAEKKRTAVINKKAEGTWLEPYIGYVVTVIAISRKKITFRFTMSDEEESHDRDVFDINPNS